MPGDEGFGGGGGVSGFLSRILLRVPGRLCLDRGVSWKCRFLGVVSDCKISQVSTLALNPKALNS